MNFLDITQTFTGNMPVYPGDPLAVLQVCATVEKDGFNDHTLTTAMHVGTHIDGPAHMILGGKKLLEFPLDHFLRKAKLVTVENKPIIEIEDLRNTILEEDDIILFHTGWSAYFHFPNYFENYPVLSIGLAEYLVEKKVKMIGIDTPSPDTAPFEVHKILLQNDILIIENLTNLDQLENLISPNKAAPNVSTLNFALSTLHFSLIALPLKLDTDSAPARVIAKI